MSQNSPASLRPWSAEERDADGRLVGLVIDSALPPALTEGVWLVAVDGSAHAQRAVIEAARLAADTRAALHLVHVQSWLSREAAETELAGRCWAASAHARTTLDGGSQAWRLHALMGETTERIAALARRLACRGIVIGSRGLGATENLLIGSVAYKLIHVSTVPVLVVR